MWKVVCKPIPVPAAVIRIRIIRTAIYHDCGGAHLYRGRLYPSCVRLRLRLSGQCSIKLGHRYIVIAEDGENATYRCTRCGHVHISHRHHQSPNPPISSYSLGEDDAEPASSTGCGSERVLKSTVTEEHSYIYASGRLLRGDDYHNCRKRNCHNKGSGLCLRRPRNPLFSDLHQRHGQPL